VNFIEDSLRRRSLSTIDALVRRAISAYPDVRFLSTLELAEAIKARTPDLIDDSLSTRLTTWCARARSELRFWKLARLTGLALFVRMLGAVIRRMPRRNLSLSKVT